MIHVILNAAAVFQANYESEVIKLNFVTMWINFKELSLYTSQLSAKHACSHTLQPYKLGRVVKRISGVDVMIRIFVEVFFSMSRHGSVLLNSANFWGCYNDKNFWRNFLVC